MQVNSGLGVNFSDVFSLLCIHSRKECIENLVYRLCIKIISVQFTTTLHACLILGIGSIWGLTESLDFFLTFNILAFV